MHLGSYCKNIPLNLTEGSAMSIKPIINIYLNKNRHTQEKNILNYKGISLEIEKIGDLSTIWTSKN